MMWNFSRLCVLACLAVCVHPAPAAAEVVYGVAEQGAAQLLVTWDSLAPQSLLSSVPLISDRPILAIDFRPPTGELYGLTNSGGFYQFAVIQSDGSVQWKPQSNIAVTGSSFGIDFITTVDWVRVVNDDDKNNFFDPDTGKLVAVTSDFFYIAGDIHAGVDPSLAGLAYGINSLDFYAIDTGIDVLVKQGGQGYELATIGTLNVVGGVSDMAGFDISRAGIAYAAMTPTGSSQSVFYTINLTTGAASPVGNGIIGGGVVITAMAVDTVPEPASTVLTALALGGLATWGRPRFQRLRFKHKSR